MNKTAEEIYLKTPNDLIAEYVPNLYTTAEQEESLCEAMHQFASQEKEKEAKEFAEYFEDYVLTLEEIIMENERDKRIKDRNVDSQYYNCDKKIWANDMSELYQQFKDKQNDSKAT